VHELDAHVGLGPSHERAHHRHGNLAGEGCHVLRHRLYVHGVQGGQQNGYTGHVGVLHDRLDGELVPGRCRVP